MSSQNPSCIDPMLLTLTPQTSAQYAAGTALCACDGGHPQALCDQCLYSSPISPLPMVGRPYSSSLDGPHLDSFSSPASQDIVQSPQIHTQQLPLRSLSNTAHPSIRIPQPTFTYDHVNQIYTPGLIAGSSGPIYQAAIPTPTTTAPSLIEESLDPFSPIPVDDFTGRGHDQVYLESSFSAFNPTQELAERVKRERYRVHATADDGWSSAIKALQKSMSFNVQGKMPATTEQMAVWFGIARQQNGAAHGSPVSYADLTKMLELYSQYSGKTFNLGVIAPGYVPTTFKVMLWHHVEGASATIWLFQEMLSSGENLIEKWSAIIPYEATTPSYAAAVAAAPPVAPASQSRAPARENSLLDPRALHTAIRENAGRRRSWVPQRQRQSRSSRAAPSRQYAVGPARSRRSSHSSRNPSRLPSRAPSECGNTQNEAIHHQRKPSEDNKPNKCAVCGKGFLYPKDLKRHMTTHSGCKLHKCSFCPKSYTRRDNVQRHMRDDHPGLTPPESLHAVL